MNSTGGSNSVSSTSKKLRVFFAGNLQAVAVQGFQGKISELKPPDILNTTRISNFFVETRVVTYSESLILQGFPLFYVQPIHIRKHQNFKDVFIRQHHYMNTVFRYSYLDMLLQTLAVFCISAFDGGELHCKNGYIHPHSFESAAQKYIHAGRPPLF